MRGARTAALLFLALTATLLASPGVVRGADSEQPVYPAAEWEKRAPEQVGLSAAKLNALAELAGGRGCVVRHGYLVYTWGDVAKSGDIASAVKPVISGAGAKAAELCVAAGGSWGLMLERVNQHYPFAFRGAADDKIVYGAIRKLTTP